MFDPNDWEVLISKVSELTSSSKLTWRDAGEHGLAARVDQVDYVVGHVQRDGRETYSFGVHDLATKSDLARIEIRFSGARGAPGGEAHQIIALYELAYRSAMGTPQLLSDLLAGLERLDAPSDRPIAEMRHPLP